VIGLAAFRIPASSSGFEPSELVRNDPRLDDVANEPQATDVTAPSPVRQLLAAYAGLWALLDVLAVLPGSNPSFSSTSGLLASVFIQCLLIWRLSLGSAVAWAIGLFMALGSVASLFLMGAPPVGLTEALFVVILFAQTGVLLTPPIRALVRSQGHTPSAAA
jgi:hypothetical protein